MILLMVGLVWLTQDLSVKKMNRVNHLGQKGIKPREIYFETS